MVQLWTWPPSEPPSGQLSLGGIRKQDGSRRGRVIRRMQVFVFPRLRSKSLRGRIASDITTTSTALVQKFPSLQCIVQDLPGTIAQAETSTNMEMSHVQFMAHDFFEDQPIRGAAVYLLRQVLHDWSDHYAVKILRKLVAASDDNSVILVMEQIMPEPGSEPRVVEQIYR